MTSFKTSSIWSLAGLLILATSSSLAFPTTQVPPPRSPPGISHSSQFISPEGLNSTFFAAGTLNSTAILDQSFIMNGTVQYFNQTSIQGACGIVTTDQELVVGMSKVLMNSISSEPSTLMTCGTCVSMTPRQGGHFGAPVIAQVQDSCDLCAPGDLCK